MSKVLLLDDTDDPEIVGQMGAQLARLAKIGIRIVDGFVIPIGQKLEFGASNEILTAFDKLNTERAVLRSSVNLQEYESETLRHIGRDALLDAISYMQQNAARRGRRVAIIVQRDVNAEVSGTVHSVNPVTLDKSEILIEANLWMNHTVLSGESEPDMLIVNKRTGALSLESNDEDEIYLSPKQISQLHGLIRKVEKHLGGAISVDWAYDNNNLYVLRARPLDERTYERFT